MYVFLCKHQGTVIVRGCLASANILIFIALFSGVFINNILYAIFNSHEISDTVVWLEIKHIYTAVYKRL